MSIAFCSMIRMGTNWNKSILIMFDQWNTPWIKWSKTASSNLNLFARKEMVRNNSEEKWKRKCQILYVCWRRRPGRVANQKGRKEKTSKDWYRSLRCMQSQWAKANSGLNNKKTRWKNWSYNVASNGRKRQRYSSERV